MSARIPYDEELSLAANMKRLRRKHGITHSQIAKQADMRQELLTTYIRFGLKTPAGHPSKTSERVRREVQKFFTTPIPKDPLTEIFSHNKKDLYTMFGCKQCRYRMRSQPGCVKFSLTKEDINRGAWVNTLKNGAYFLDAKKPCPYATRVIS